MRSASGRGIVTPPLVWVALGVSFVVGLAAVVRMAGPVPPDGVHGVIRLPVELTATIATLLVLAVAVFTADVIRRAWSRRRPDEADAESLLERARVPPWVRAVRQVLAVAYFVTLAYLLSRGAFSLEGLMALGAGASAGAGFPLPRLVREAAPPVLTWTFGVLALVASAGALALAVWVALSDRRERSEVMDEVPAPPALEAAVADSLDDLHTEADARRAIVRCYARFERAAAESGVPRKPWATPAEFMREALARLSPPAGALPTLTGLFELARFSDRPLGRIERDRAVDALDQIKAALAARDGDVAAR